MCWRCRFPLKCVYFSFFNILSFIILFLKSCYIIYLQRREIKIVKVIGKYCLLILRPNTSLLGFLDLKPFYYLKCIYTHYRIKPYQSTAFPVGSLQVIALWILLWYPMKPIKKRRCFMFDILQFIVRRC